MLTAERCRSILGTSCPLEDHELDQLQALLRKVALAALSSTQKSARHQEEVL